MSGPGDEGATSEHRLVEALVTLMRESRAAGTSFQQALAEAEQVLLDAGDGTVEAVMSGREYSSSLHEHTWHLSAPVVRWNQRGEPELMTLTDGDLNDGIRVASARMFAQVDDALDELCACVVRYAIEQRGRAEPGAHTPA